jgi:hypothetical protein
MGINQVTRSIIGRRLTQLTVWYVGPNKGHRLKPRKTMLPTDNSEEPNNPDLGINVHKFLNTPSHPSPA